MVYNSADAKRLNVKDNNMNCLCHGIALCHVMGAVSCQATVVLADGQSMVLCQWQGRATMECCSVALQLQANVADLEGAQWYGSAFGSLKYKCYS
mmetsp:Transcript_51478/g.84723  ORF Transcript_51478/g.84723 Transcript_51478/m.84723 type:complete len:95 (-) Transcript_51478:464-748(-)